MGIFNKNYITGVDTGVGQKGLLTPTLPKSLSIVKETMYYVRTYICTLLVINA